MEQEFEKFPVYCLENALKFDFDWLVICLVYYNEIEEKINKLFTSIQKITSKQEFYQKVIFKKYHEQLLSKNDLYYFACKKTCTSFKVVSLF